MQTVCISIGRGIPSGGVMDSPNWEEFKTAVTDAAENHSQHALLFVGEGEGRYEGEDGYVEKCEPSHVLIAFIPERNIDGLRAKLAKIASVYDQDAIGFIAAHDTTTLISREG